MQLTSYLDYGYDMNVRKGLSFGSGSRIFAGVTLGSTDGGEDYTKD